MTQCLSRRFLKVMTWIQLTKSCGKGFKIILILVEKKFSSTDVHLFLNCSFSPISLFPGLLSVSKRPSGTSLSEAILVLGFHELTSKSYFFKQD